MYVLKLSVGGEYFWEKQGAGVDPPGSDAYRFLKTPHRPVRSHYDREIVWAKEDGSWRDLEIV